jgi:SAM-dependent methyltransferase
MTVVQQLDRVVPAPADKPVIADAAGMQESARRIALDRSAWTPEAASFTTQLFDELASAWNAEHSTGRADPLLDALARGGGLPSGICLEIGSGTSEFTPILAGAFERVIALDISMAMLREADRSPGARVRADAARLPLEGHVVAVVACVDTLLFPAEISRVLAADGALIWVNQLGVDGPLFLPTPTVIEALGGGWRAVEAESGWGTWAVVRRSA